MEQDVIKADVQYRKKVQWFALIGFIIILLVIIFVFPVVENWLKNMEIEKALKTIGTILFFLFLIPIPLGFKFLSISNHILREQRYPPEGTKVIYDQIIIRGDKARLRAYLFLLMAFLIFFISVFCAFSAHIFLKILLNTGSLL